VVQTLAAAAQHFGADTVCDLLVAFKDVGSWEQEAAEQLEFRYTRLAMAGKIPALSFQHRSIFDEAVRAPFQLDASFLVSCSYHVAFSGILSCCPTVLLAENDYYRQKAAGLTDAFGTRRFAILEPKDSPEEIVRTLLAGPRSADANLCPRDDQLPRLGYGQDASAAVPHAESGAASMWIGQSEKALELARVCLEMKGELVRDLRTYLSQRSHPVPAGRVRQLVGEE
jgi:hypothetical protein